MEASKPRPDAGLPVVLIVDDDDVIRAVAAESLRPLGFHVIEAESGEKALEMAPRHAPDAILMDVNMPGLDGFATTAALRELPGFELVPVLFLTACEDVAAIERAFEVGATDFAIKPVHWQVIGHRLRYMMRVVDLTDQQKRLLAEVQRSQKTEAVATLASGIAHDFNNVLMAIRGTAELVRLDLPEDGEAYDDLGDILSAADTGSALIRQLLSYGRSKELRRSDVDLNENVRAACRLLQRALPSNTRIDVQLEDGPLTVRADPVQIEQILMNLALNARDAMPEGGTIRVRAEATSDGARLTVADSGRGIDAETLDRIFEPFFSTKPKEEGSGLGLAMVRDIVSEHDGRISCRSEPGLGTTFEILLPLAGGVVRQGVSAGPRAAAY